jgi:hypothetical protein
MMQATDLGDLHDPARLGKLDGSAVRRIFGEREMRASPVIVREIAGQDAAQVRFAEDQNVIQTLAADRADEALRERILPRTLRCRKDFLDVHALHSMPKRRAVDLITVAQEIRGCGLVREGVHDLLGGPVRGGVIGHVEVDDAPPMMSEHDEDEEHAQARSGHSEETNRDEVLDMIGQERPPGLRGQEAPLRHEPGDGALGHVDAELEELAMDSRGCPEIP